MAEYIGYTFNKGIKSFGENKVKQILESFNKRYKKYIVSMGSGSGSIEHYTKDSIKWILIDPEPESFHGSVIMEPNYKYLDELINSNPSIIGNCLLFLNWCEPNDNAYDYEAIIKLQPIAICSIYEEYESSYGAAGSEKFYNWTLLNQHDDSDYKMIEEHYLSPHDYDMDNLNIMIKIWQSNKIPFENEDIIITYTKSLISHECGSCCIS